MPHRVPTADQSAAELKRQIEHERAGEPFLVYREPAGEQRVLALAGRERVVIGREEGVDLRIDDDEAVSRLHAELVRVGGSWVVADDGLSTNGTIVDGERLLARRRLADRSLIVVGGTGVLYREPAGAPSTTPTRAAAPGENPVPALGEVQRRVLIALCRPLAGGHAYAAAPAPNQAIAAELFMSVGAVKANLRALFEKFGVDQLPQNEKRIALAERALRDGAVRPSELGPPRG
jgi:FHA domain-containing protein